VCGDDSEKRKIHIMAEVLCALYPDPQAGYPPNYARDEIPTITAYANGQTDPTPKGPLGFRPGELVGCVSGELVLRSYLEKAGHELIVTMPFNGMTPHISGSTLSAQTRYAAGTLEILQSYFDGTPVREEYLIVDGGALAGTGARSYKLT
jgi:hypothetical protein